MEIGVKEKLERWRILGEIFLGQDKRVLIKDLEDNWYFADLLLVGEETLTFQCFAPSQRAGEKFTMFWARIKSFEELRDEV